MTHIEAMKQALEALEEQLADFPLEAHRLLPRITSLRQAIATAVAEQHKESSATQEPVAWITGTGELVKNPEQFSHWMVWWTPLYTHPQPKAEQEPKREPFKYTVTAKCCKCGNAETFDLTIGDDGKVAA